MANSKIYETSVTGYRNTIKCSSILLQYPLAFIGKSNGRCDIWDILINRRLRSLQHEPVDASTLLRVVKVVALEEVILSLTDRGKIYCWDKKASLDRSQPKSQILMWTHRYWVGYLVS